MIKIELFINDKLNGQLRWCEISHNFLFSPIFSFNEPNSSSCIHLPIFASEALSQSHNLGRERFQRLLWELLYRFEQNHKMVTVQPKPEPCWNLLKIFDQKSNNTDLVITAPDFISVSKFTFPSSYHPNRATLHRIFSENISKVLEQQLHQSSYNNRR